MLTFEKFRKGTRIVLKRLKSMPTITLTGPNDVYSFFRPLVECAREKMYSVCVDCSGLVVGVDLVSAGTLDTSFAPPREVFRVAMIENQESPFRLPDDHKERFEDLIERIYNGAYRRGAHRVIIVHNHPNGSPNPGPNDIQASRNLKLAGYYLGCPLQDSIIVARNGFYSMDQHGDI